ncbi:MAG: STAS domain-containing protein [Labedaea sp.]
MVLSTAHARPVSLTPTAPRPVSRPECLDYHAMRLSVTRPASGHTLVTVSGDVDALTAPRLHELLTHRLRTRPTTLTVDLSQVTFLGVAGLTVLARSVVLAKMRGIRLRLAVGDNRTVARLVDLAGLAYR